MHLRTYTGEDIKVLGVTSVNVRYGNQQAVLTIHVVEGGGPDLIGRDWLSHYNITFDVIDQVEQPPTLQKILDKHAAVFDGNLGCMKDVEVTLQVKTEVKPKFLRPRKVPYILKQKVEEELDRLSIGGGTRGARGPCPPPPPPIFRLMVLAPPDFIQLFMSL